MGFNSDQRRNLQNLRQFYDTWKEVAAQLQQLPGGMYWKVAHSKEYLYKYFSRSGIRSATSLGPRGPDTEARKAQFDQGKSELEERRIAIEARIKTLAPVMRALKLPAIDEIAGNILRAVDQVDALRGKVLLVGTYAMTAYEMTAENRFAEGFEATEDLDFTVVLDDAGTADADFPRQLLLTLRELDRSFVVSPSSPKTVVNKHGYRVDLLTSERVAPAMKGAIPWKPQALEGQEWLTCGIPIQALVIDQGGWPAMLTVPDPRYFALHKLWLSKRPLRIREGKAPKDLAQGKILLGAVEKFMPHYPMDREFAAALPATLKSILEGERPGR